MFQDNVLQTIAINARNGMLKSVQDILSSTLTAGVATTYKIYTLPDWVHGFRIYPSAAIRFAIGEIPAAIGTTTFVVGGIGNINEWTSKIVEDGVSRTLQVTTLATATITLELF